MCTGGSTSSKCLLTVNAVSYVMHQMSCVKPLNVNLMLSMTLTCLLMPPSDLSLLISTHRNCSYGDCAVLWATI